jgi:hypothetical protein
VLIVMAADHESMFGLLVIAFVLAVGPLAVFYGVDSRGDDVARRRRLGA